MKIVVKQRNQGGECRWQVSLDKQCVDFRSEAQAREFVSTLEKRLRAPHVLPAQPEQRRAS